MTSSVLHLSTSDSEVTSFPDTWETEFEQHKQLSASSTFLQEYLQNLVTRQPNSTYVMKFPWKPSYPPLPTNKSTCERRVRSLAYKLSKTPEILEARFILSGAGHPTVGRSSC